MRHDRRTSEERKELAEVAKLLRDNRIPVRRIAELLDVTPGYIRNVLNDPDGAKDRARKASYAGTCEKCGRRTSGANGRAKAPKICIRCATEERHLNRYWTAERVIEAIRRWAATHGGVPPKSSDWNHAGRGDGYPAVTSVYKSSSDNGAPFAFWSDAIEAAGFPRPRVGHYERDSEWRAKLADRKHWTRERIIKAILAHNLTHGRPPTATEWTKRKGDEDRPAYDTVRKEFGSFRAALEAAGFKYHRMQVEPRQKKGKVVTVEELVKRSRILDQRRMVNVSPEEAPGHGKTASGVKITDELVTELAEKAEAGYATEVEHE